MAFSGVFRRTASALSPLALRAIRARTALQNPSSARELCRTLVIHNSPFSSLAKNSISNDHLLTVIDSEIKCALESDNHNQIDGIPNGFPFELQDNPGQQTVTLRREYGGEVITVDVYMPDLVTGDEGGNDDDDDSKSGQSSIPLVVSVSKGDGPCLEFGCTAYPDEVAIDSMSVKDSEAPEDQIAYEGPDFSDLDENLQKGFHKYLEIRGIKASTTNFLHEYMINKDSREYLNWLKNLKNFIGK